MLDNSKLPSNLVVRRVWVPKHVSDTRRPIAYVIDRPRRVAGTALIASGVVLAVYVLVSRTAFWLAFVALLIARAGVAYAVGGRTGFYELDEDCGLGRFLGRSRPPSLDTDMRP
jgi:hypothetical protein